MVKRGKIFKCVETPSTTAQKRLKNTFVLPLWRVLDYKGGLV